MMQDLQQQKPPTNGDDEDIDRTLKEKVQINAAIV